MGESQFQRLEKRLALCLLCAQERPRKARTTFRPDLAAENQDIQSIELEKDVNPEEKQSEEENKDFAESGSIERCAKFKKFS